MGDDRAGRWLEYDHEPDLSVTWPFWPELWEVLKDRGHWWCFSGDLTTHAAFEFIDAYLTSRGEEPTLGRAIEVMDEYFLMLREGAVVPVDDKRKLHEAASPKPRTKAKKPARIG